MWEPVHRMAVRYCCCCVANQACNDPLTCKTSIIVNSLHVLHPRRVGDPFGDVDQGPQINQSQIDKIEYYVKEGQKEGAKIAFGGHRIGDKGYYYAPTIFVDVHDKMKIAQVGPGQCGRHGKKHDSKPQPAITSPLMKCGLWVNKNAFYWSENCTSTNQQLPYLSLAS